MSDSKDPEMTIHPEAELLAAFVEGRLADKERVAMERHMADCAACRSSALAALGAPATSVTWRRVLLPAGIAAAALLLLIPFRGQDTNTPVVRGPGTTPELPRIAIISPLPGTTAGSAPTFQWHAMAGAVSYRLTVTTDEGDPVWSTITSDTVASLPPDRPLSAEVTYAWLVDALLADGKAATSGSVEFRIAR